MNKYILYCLIALFLFSCSVKNQQENGYVQYDSLTRKYVYHQVEQMPKYKSGSIDFMRDFSKHFHYSFQKDENIQTKLRFQFVIDTDGNLIGARIYDKKDENLTNFEKAGLEALQFLQKWEPGRNNNKKVNVMIVMPLNIDPQ